MVCFAAFLAGNAGSLLHHANVVKLETPEQALGASTSKIERFVPEKDSVYNSTRIRLSKDERHGSDKPSSSTFFIESQLQKRCEIEEILLTLRLSDDFSSRVQELLEKSENGETEYTSEEVLQTLVPLLREDGTLESFFKSFPMGHPSWGNLLTEIVIDSTGVEPPIFQNWLELQLNPEKLRHAKSVYSYVLSHQFRGTPQDIITKIDFGIEEEVDAFGRFLARQESPEQLLSSLELESINQSSKNLLIASIAKEVGKRDPEMALVLSEQFSNEYSGLQKLELELREN